MVIHVIHHNVRSWKNQVNRNINCNYYLNSDPDVITINAHSLTNIKILLNY